ncbi:MAG: tyrosine-type recombinase/integrase [Planctomycetota bacterium]|nr:tyrosine-type recombinase/integrase [Planctomycetota bacterium]
MAVAEWKEGKLTIWTGTQNPFGCKAQIASAVNVSADNVRVIVPDFGGGFGGKHAPDAAVEAARLAITVLAWTGLRIGELIDLRWQDVDLKARVLHVRVREDWRPKDKRDRIVPIFPKVEAVLRQQRVGEFVFTGPRGGRLTESHVLEFLHADQRKLGLPEKDVHGFRRFFATHMMTKCKVDAETVRQWGGWKSLETMLRYLADVDVKDTVAAMEQAVRQLAAS